MAHVPLSVSSFGIDGLLKAAGFMLHNMGKVRNSYLIPGHRDKLLVIATERISIFDFVLNALVHYKGEVLTAMTVFWLRKVLNDYPHHLLAAGREIDEFLPPSLRGNAELQKSALVVLKMDTMYLIEFIYREYLTGSGYIEYLETLQLGGCKLEAGMIDGQRLPSVIFDPTNKASVGHDTRICGIDVRSEHPDLVQFLNDAYRKAMLVAGEQGVIIADTKLEAGQRNGRDFLADEVFTPDSSRFWYQEDYAEAQKQKKAPPSRDKQFVRNWGKSVATPFGCQGIHHLLPENNDHRDFVDQLEIPPEICVQTSETYRSAFHRLIGSSLEDFQRNVMGIAV